MPDPCFVVGDVHGHRDVLVALLEDAGLVDASERWKGGGARLWFLGDLVDRGPDGIGAVDLVRRLQHESGGNVGCLLGNHEALLLAAHRFADGDAGAGDESFYGLWKLNGGVDRDLQAVTPEHVAWLSALPPIALEEDWLLLHADTDAYLELGRSIDDVARRTRAALTDGSAGDVDEVLTVVSDRMRLVAPDVVEVMLSTYGGTRIVHGHTPIAFVRDVPPADVHEPLVYAGGRVTNADHCLFAGGSGFVMRLEGGSGSVA